MEDSRDLGSRFVRSEGSNPFPTTTQKETIAVCFYGDL